MAERPRLSADADSLLARMGKERFVLGFVSDNLAGMPLTARNAARELGTALDRVGLSCTDVSTALAESFARVRQFQEQSEKLGESSESTFKRLEEVSEALKRSLADAADLIRAVSHFQTAGAGMQPRTAVLEEASHGVREEAARLVELAEQINLLALNSVIEADHTGREGRPFAVLAQEIRTIASRTAEEASEVQQIVEKIEHDVLEATGRVDSNEQSYREGAVKAGELSPDLAALERSLAQLRDGQEDFRREYRSLADHLADIRTRYEQMTAVTERVVLTSESVGAAMREEQDSLTRLAASVDDVLGAVEGQRGARSAEQTVEAVRANLSATGALLTHCFASERELTSGLDNAERLASDQTSSASLAERKSERLEVLASSLADRAGFIRARGQELLANWETRVLAQVLALISHIDLAATKTHEAVEAMGALEARIRQIDLVAASIARATLKIDLLALTGSIEASKAGVQGGGFGAVASQVRQLAGESGQVADRIQLRGYHLNSALSVIRRSFLEAEGVARTEHARSGRARKNLHTLEESLRGLGASLEAVFQSTTGAATQAGLVLKDAAILVKASESTTAGIQSAARALASTSAGLASLSRGVEKVASRLEA
ncbi:MAG: hypothetical protein HYY25_06960 [Candidatus Wallbacteria bacterium]|nr:hypothetical protein [Candidatus Wallbacteria bacterium]